MLLEEIKKKLVFYGLTGSRAYNLHTEDSDYDYRGIFQINPELYFNLNFSLKQISFDKNDEIYYTILRFLELATNSNPNILEILYLPEDCVQISTDIWKKIIENRNIFISKFVLRTYIHYAISQIKRAKGQNKLVNNPMSENKPVKEDFCWIIPMCNIQDSNWDFPCSYSNYRDRYVAERLTNGDNPSRMPFRPQKISGTKFNLDCYHVSKIENMHDAYRLYHYGENAKGVFRGDDMLACENIPIDDEIRFAGILIYNKDAFDRELKLWNQYWGWKQNRNEARWVDQEAEDKEARFDRKNMSHTFRLLYEGEHILEYGYPKVRFEGETLQKLKDIRNNKYSYDDLLQEANERLVELDSKADKSNLPNNPDYNKINKLSIELHKMV
jgi:predicted nucleotidyltransferase